MAHWPELVRGPLRTAGTAGQVKCDRESPVSAVGALGAAAEMAVGETHSWGLPSFMTLITHGPLQESCTLQQV